MAVTTGMKTGNGKLTEEQKQMAAKAKRPVDIANKFRLAFMLIAVLALIFIYFGNKLWEGVPWYDNTVNHMYGFLLWDIALMLAATFAKLFFAAKYNQIVRSL